MRLFLSAGEPSGDLHAANLIHRIRAKRPDTTFVGLGGDRMKEAGCEILFPLTDLAVVGLLPVLASLHKFHSVLGIARESFQTQRPDALVMVDFPGFHWWLAGCAQKNGIPVSYFVPPQIWGWATWRAKKMRRLCNQVLASMPFEDEWFRSRGIPSQLVGHPYFDELQHQHTDTAWIAEQQSRPGPIVALLPGSRNGEVRHNLSSLIRGAELVHAKRPDVRFLVAAFKPAQAEKIRETLKGSKLPIEVHQGRTPEILEAAHSVMSVSGSVSLEILCRTKPAVMIYQHHWLMISLGHMLKRAKYITLVNLLADRLILPEYFSAKCLGATIAEHILHWLNDDAAYRAKRAELAALKAVVMKPGATDRAADAILNLVRASNPAVAA
jgi:lipid-A-disaccharide synthase